MCHHIVAVIPENNYLLVHLTMLLQDLKQKPIQLKINLFL